MFGYLMGCVKGTSVPAMMSPPPTTPAAAAAAAFKKLQKTFCDHWKRFEHHNIVIATNMCLVSLDYFKLTSVSNSE